jgi:hypothetical protein
MCPLKRDLPLVVISLSQAAALKAQYMLSGSSPYQSIAVTWVGIYFTITCYNELNRLISHPKGPA